MVSRSLHVDTEYLPQRIMIQSPATIMEGEEAAVSCLTSQSHPAPRVTWKLEKVGATHEIRESRRPCPASPPSPTPPPESPGSWRRWEPLTRSERVGGRVLPHLPVPPRPQSHLEAGEGGSHSRDQ